MVKPRGKLVRDCDVTSRDLSFRSVWRELKGQGWTSKRPPRRSLDGRYLYVRPGGDPDGTAGVDFFLGEGAVLEYYANILQTRARTPRPSDPGDAELERAARVVEETYGHLIEGSPAHGQAAAGANPRGPSLSVTSARQTSSLQLASGQVPPALRAQGPPHSARAHVPAATWVAQAPPAALRSKGRPPAAHTQGLATADDDHGPPLAARLEGQPRAARGQDQLRALRSQGRSGAAHVQLPSAADGHGPPHAQAQTRAARVQMPAMTPCGQGPPATVCAQGSPSTARAGLNRERGASRPTRRMLVCTDSPMTTPPRRISTSTPLCTTSPHVHDESADSCDDAAASDGTLQLDGASVHSAEDAIGSDIDTCEEDEGEVDPLSTELLADNDDDLNAVGDGEDADDYGAMESGDDADKDDLEAGEDDEDGDCDRAAYESEGDEVEPTESEIAAEVLFAEDFLSRFGGEDAVLAGNLKNDVLREMSASGWEDLEEPDTYDYMQTPYDPVSNTQSYPGLRQGYSGPTPEALRNADSPLALFFFFMPVALWQHIAVCSNEYSREMVSLRVDETHKRYRARRRLNPQLPKKTKRDIRNELEGMKPILPHEICRFIGLLIARTIAPNREKLAHHWKTTDEGGIARGAFGSVLRRDRFMEISRNLHFNPNSDPRAATDRAWKIRKVVEVLQRTFERGYVAPPHLAFDEAILPSRSSFNKMRVYMKDKPHKWGTKLFMLCSAVTAYCIRFEVYCGKKEHTSDAHKTDMKSGPAAVVRNLLAVFGADARKQGMRLVVVDRFYTSVALAIQLLLMGFYCVGTIMTSRLGYCKSVIENKKSRPATIARGTFKLARSKQVPHMTAIMWWDSRPVHFLCTGGSLEMDRVVRQDRAMQQEVPCPRVVKDYHAFMGGVDVHDQLRLQRYSIQRAVRFKKYYKSLVLGLIDLAIVNSYIVHKAYHKNKESRPLTHVKFMKKLHLQLCQLRATDMCEANTFSVRQATARGAPEQPPRRSTQATHAPQQLDEWRDKTTQPKRRQRACKVCSLLRSDGKRAATTAYFCGECSQQGPVFLCTKPRRTMRGVAMTCWDVWHREWNHGKLIPVDTGRSIRMRRSADAVAAPSTPGTPVTPLTPIGPASSSKRRKTNR